MTRSTPRSSDSGNIMPASMTMMSSPKRRAIMFMPNSPRPPRGMAKRDCGDFFKKELAPKTELESYHTGDRRKLRVESRVMGHFKFPTYCVTNREIQTDPLPES